MLNKENYVPWSSRLLRYAKIRPNRKLIYNSIMNGPYVRQIIPEPGDPARTVLVLETFHEQIDDELIKSEIKQMKADDKAIQTILLGLPEDIYVAVDSCETAQEIWLHVQQMMKGSDIGIQEKKAKLFNKWERFTSTDGESIESYYHRFSKLMNDFKRNKHFLEKISSNLKFLNNLQPEWSRHVTIVHQTKDLHTADYTQLYDFLKYNQKEVDELRAERLAKTQDPLALMANSNNPFKYLVFHPDLPSSSTYIQQPLPNNNYNPQPSFNQNHMQQPMPNPEDITDPTTAMNMALALMAKAFKLNYSTPTNNNQRISSNPQNRQNVGNQVVQNQGVQNVGNQNRVIVVPGIANQNGDGNVVAARAEDNANGNNGNQIRCYNCRGLSYLARNRTVRPRRRDVAYLQTQLLIAQKEEAGIQLQDEEFDLMAAAADLDEIEEVNANYILMANLQQASTSGTQTNTAPVYDSGGSAEVSSVEQGGGTVEQHSANVEETRAYHESLFHNLAAEVEKSVYQEQCLSKKINALHLSSGKQITALNEEISNLNKQLSKEKSTVSSLQEEKKRLKSDFKVREDELLDKQIHPENKVKELDNILVKTGVDITTKTRGPQPRSNTKNDRALHASKSSRIKNKEVKVEDHPRNLLLSKNKKHMSSECNNIKIAIRNDNSKIVCAMCKKYLITTNHDACVLNYVNGMKSRSKKHKENMSKIANQMKHKAQVWKPKNVGSKERLASPKPSQPRMRLRWSPTGNMFGIKGKIIASSESNGYPNMIMFLGTVRFGNDHVAAILGFGNLQWGNILITRVYFVEGLGHNLFSVEQFCNSDLEHRHLSHLNFDTINDLARNDLVTGLSNFKYHKEHLCPSCEQGKSKRASHPPKLVPNSKQRLHLLHMDLCGPMRIASINGKRYVFVIVDDYSRYTWVVFLKSKDEAPEEIKTFLKRITILLQAHVILKPDISFLHVFGALCYLKNDREDIGKLGAKGDIGFFIGYSANSCAYRVYNRRTKKIIETMNMTFDEISAMAFEQSSLKPGLQSMTSERISSGLDLPYAPSTITTQRPTEGDLDLLFEAMYDDHIGSQPSAAPRTVPAAQAPHVLQTPTATTTTADTAPTPTNSSSLATSIPSTSQNVDELDTQQQHVNQSPYGIFINQSKYVLEILKKYGMETCDHVGTPMKIKDKLDLDQHGSPVDAMKYHSMIGALIYLTSSRTEIVHATCLCARYQAKPTEKHLKEDVKTPSRVLPVELNS
ncbi:retrovirus-related pol polyprotein from transposon TNT 1-94 [Tanacetum coccineum]|uniref:Retrovirus-related pol polyprotein from transposon TNT 1-94 n=1 Tax=Tanacetum coccineum TaxID=301880 RepID=A0ABQ5HXG6_9ASTR